MVQVTFNVRRSKEAPAHKITAAIDMASFSSEQLEEAARATFIIRAQAAMRTWSEERLATLAKGAPITISADSFPAPLREVSFARVSLAVQSLDAKGKAALLAALLNEQKSLKATKKK